MKGYSYNEKFQFVEAIELPKAPGQDDQYLVTREDVTIVKPPKEKDGYIAVFNPDTEKWTNVAIVESESE